MPSSIHQGEIVPFDNPTALPPAGSFSPPPGEAAPSLSLRDFFAILRRRKLAAFSVFALVLALGVLATFLSKPIYRTGARLLVEGRTNSFALSNDNGPLTSVFQPKAGRDVDTQVEILRSAVVLDRVFKQAGVPPGLVDVDVRRVDRTDVIELTTTSTSRIAAQRVALALPLVYEQDTRNDRLRDVSGALDFATKNLGDQTEKLRRTEAALARFRTAKGVVNPDAEATQAVTAAAQSQSDLSKAELDADRLQAQLNALTGQRASLSPFVQTPVTLTNPQIQVLRDRLAELNSLRAQKLFLYKPTDDEVRQVDLQINDLKTRLASTPPTITNTSRAPNPAIAGLDEKIGTARADLRAAQNTLGPLRRQVAGQTGNLSRFNTIARREAELLRDLDASSNAVKTLAANQLQLSLRKTALASAGAPVSTMAQAGPAVKISPSLTRNLIASLFLGLLLACGAALLQESLDDHIRDQEEARQMLGTSILGQFALRPSKQGRPLLDLNNPDRYLLESFRALRSNVQFALVNSPGRRLLVTSAVPGEGKSYIASNLAVAMALNGHNVILVDADLHRPRVHETFDIPLVPGLTNALVGETKLQDCVREVGVPGLRVITAGVTPPNPAELLGSSTMETLIDRLGKGANVVIFDSPPLLATADSQVLASKMDGVIYVMQLGRAPRSAIGRAFELLRQARARVIGIVFNQVEDQSTKSYYGDYFDGPTQPLLGPTSGSDSDSNTRKSSAKADKVLLSPANGFKRKKSSAPTNGTPANGVSTNGTGANGASTPAMSPEGAVHLDHLANGTEIRTDGENRPL